MAYITKGIGGFYYVKTPDGIVECKARGIFRKRGITPVAGDNVTLSADGTMIDEILPRKNVFIRPPIANLDILFIVTSTTQPVPSTLVLDQLAAAAIYKDVQPVLVVTKADLAAADMLRTAYAGSGIPLVQLNYETGEGLDEVKRYISGHLCAFCGNSGVGKSSILNCLGFSVETGEVSEKLGRGRHTTRHIELYALGDDTFVADTPGFSSFDTERMDLVLKEQLPEAFSDFAPYLGKCQFPDCAHLKEPGCAVRAALEQGKIEPTRYDSYRRLYELAKDIKPWELKERGN